MRAAGKLFVAIAITASLLAGGCRTYRYACRGGLACETDRHCREGCDDDGEGGYCVNSRCAECRIDAHCAAGDDESCIGGQCVGPPPREVLSNDDFQEPTGISEPVPESVPAPAPEPVPEQRDAVDPPSED